MLISYDQVSDHQDASLGVSGASNQLNTENRMAIGKGIQAIQDIIKLPIRKGDTIHFISDGVWSMHHLTEFLLQITGPANIHFATWSISEFSARKLCQWLSTGEIIQLKGVLDFRSKNRHIEAFHLAKQNFTELKLANCHAKLTVIHNDRWRIVINGSPNWTENPRLESGTISIDDNTADQFIKLIDQLILKSEYELN